jgi:hypothetical protein
MPKPPNAAFSVVVCTDKDVSEFPFETSLTLEGRQFKGKGEYTFEVDQDLVSVSFPTGTIVNGDARQFFRPFRGGELVEIGKATAVLVPKRRPITRDLSWDAHTYLLANSKVAVLLRLALLGHAALTTEILERIARMDPKELAGHEPLFNELVEASARLAADDKALRTALLSAIDGVEVVHSASVRRPASAQNKHSLLSPAVRDAIAQLTGKGRGAPKAKVESASVPKALSPEHDGKQNAPTVAWDLVASKSNVGHGWAKGTAPLGTTPGCAGPSCASMRSGRTTVGAHQLQD